MTEPNKSTQEKPCCPYFYECDCSPNQQLAEKDNRIQVLEHRNKYLEDQMLACSPGGPRILDAYDKLRDRYEATFAEKDRQIAELAKAAEMEFQRAEGKAEMKRWFQEELVKKDMLIEKMVGALKSVNGWFESMKKDQHEKLVLGQTLESASENWETLLNEPLEMQPIKDALDSHKAMKGEK